MRSRKRGGIICSKLRYLSIPTADTAIATSAIIATASLVVSVMFAFAPSPDPWHAAWYHGPGATSPAVVDDKDGRFAASRQPATAASRAAGLKGFCRLETAPSLLAMVRKSGPEPDSDVMGLPEITMIGISGCC